MPEQTGRIIVVGAGPVGALLALTLAQRGYEVDAYERRADMRRGDVGAGRSINLAVSARGLHALAAVGLDADTLRQSVAMRGRMVHAADGYLTFLRYGRDDTECIHSMSRAGLNKLLMTAAEATGKVRFHFGARLVDFDFHRRIGRFCNDGTGQGFDVEAPIVFGTDGSASALRAAIIQPMRDAGNGLARLDEQPLDFGYKELTIPRRPGDGLGPGGRFALAPDALHIWPRGGFLLIALPNEDGSFTCTIFLPFETSAAAASTPHFGRLRDARAVADLFGTWFADAAPWLPNVARAFLDAPLGHMVTVRCAPWHAGAALLLGDAAHAIVPFFGQGMNAGFEDCTVLAELIDAAQPRSPADWSELMAQFAVGRTPDTDAIADLALENFVEMRDRVADPAFLLQRTVEADVQRRIGTAYLTRYQLVTFTRVPYRAALAVGRLQDAVLAEACAGARQRDDVALDLLEAAMRERVVPALQALGL
ncbi:MAG: FAD-dependent monooxygenase [Myxococcales bacterium]|nr:FAD-dependent monooxygenase [Myxococcales bacterium]